MTLVPHGYDNILWLEVPVDDVIRVQMLKSQESFRYVKRHIADNLLVRFFYLAEQRATFDVFQFKVQILSILKSTVDLDCEGAEIC